MRNVVHRGLHRFIERNDASGLHPPVVEKIRNILTFLQDIEDVQEMRHVPGWKVHQLAGDTARFTRFREVLALSALWFSAPRNRANLFHSQQNKKHLLILFKQIHVCR
jgi:hypothetical protein